MAKVDIDKFIASLCKKKIDYALRTLINEALDEQSLRFDGNDLVEIKHFKLEEGKWYVFTHASLHYDTMNGEVTFKQGKPYKAIGESTLLGDSGDYCFRGQEDMLKNLRLATEEEIAKMQGQIKPKFKVGDTIVYKGTGNMYPTKMVISEIAGGDYWDDNGCIVPIGYQDQWELVESESSDFTKALAECIHQAQGSVVDPMAHAEKWESELRKLAVEQKPESNALDSEESDLEKEIAEVQKPENNAVDILDGIDLNKMVDDLRGSIENWEFKHYDTLNDIAERFYRKGICDLLDIIKEKKG